MKTTIFSLCFLLFGAITVQAQKDNGSAEFEKGITAYNNNNFTEAMNWFKKSADKGNETSMFNIGYMYYSEKDYDNSYKWYKKSAEKGYANAMYNLSLAYLDGLGVSKNEAEAIKWMKKAVDMNFEPAQKITEEWAVSYFTQGKYFEATANYKEAHDYFKKAAELNLASAMQELGIMYYNGNGVTKNYPEAINWYKKAADKGDTEAMYKLGLIYFIGRVTEKNNTEAYKMLKKASDKGHEKAKKAIADNWE